MCRDSQIRRMRLWLHGRKIGFFAGRSSHFRDFSVWMAVWLRFGAILSFPCRFRGETL
jgi:hypothetical protein